MASLIFERWVRRTALAQLRGPLGIWTFPILNALLQRLQLQAQHISKPLLQNKETITWQDWKGRPRKIEIHREVE
jgi:hypothetical protein